MFEFDSVSHRPFQVCFRQAMQLKIIGITQNTMLNCITTRVRFNNNMGISRYLYLLASACSPFPKKDAFSQILNKFNKLTWNIYDIIKLSPERNCCYAAPKLINYQNHTSIYYSFAKSLIVL